MVQESARQTRGAFLRAYIILLHFTDTVFFCLFVFCFFSKFKVRSNPALSQSVGTIISTVFTHVVSLCYVLIALTIFQMFFIITLFVMMVCVKFFFFFFFFFCFSGPYLQHMEVPRLGVQSELQLPVCVRATAKWDPRHVCDLHHSSQQPWILDPLSKVRD